MSISIERYKEESKKVDIAGIEWDSGPRILVVQGRPVLPPLLIDNEEWAIKTPKHSPVGELTTRRAPQAEKAVRP